jgi:hypothetical protein
MTTRMDTVRTEAPTGPPVKPTAPLDAPRDTTESRSPERSFEVSPAADTPGPSWAGWPTATTRRRRTWCSRPPGCARQGSAARHHELILGHEPAPDRARVLIETVDASERDGPVTVLLEVSAQLHTPRKRERPHAGHDSAFPARVATGS